MSELHAEPADQEPASFSGDDPGEIDSGKIESGEIDRQTLLWAMAGDDRAFARLVQHYDLSLRGLVYPQVGHADLTDRVLASTYLQAYRALARLKGAPDPGPWLSAIAAKACAAEIRRQTQRRQVARRRDPTRPPPGARPVDISPRLDPVRTGGVEQGLPTPRAKPIGPPAGRRTEANSTPTEERPAHEPPEPSADPSKPNIDTAAATVDLAHASDHDPGAAEPRAAEPEADAPSDDQTPPPVEPVPVAEAPPEHDPDFWNRLGSRLLAEREIPARPAPPVEQFAAARRRVREAGSASPTDANGGPTLTSPATVEELAQRAHVPGRAQRAGLMARRVIVIVTVLAALGGVVYLAFRIGGNARPINRSGMTTGRLADKVTATLDQSQFVSGTFTHIEQASPQSITSFRLTWSHDGSFRLKGVNAPVDSSYDAATGTSRQSTTTTGADGMQAKQVEVTGLAGGPPDPHAAMDPFFDHDLPAVLQAMRSVPDGVVSTTSVQGRPAWQTELDLRAGGRGSAGGAPEHARLRIDQQLLVPVQLSVSRKGRGLRTYSLDDISLDQPPSLDAFTVAFGPGPVDHLDTRFARTTLNDIGARLPGSRPATPTYLPDGYELAEVAVLAGQGGRTGAQGRNPPDDNVVSLTYRRGWERVSVTTRANTASTDQRWSDPFAAADPAPTAETVRINGGRFRLVDAQRVTPADGVPYLWGVSRDVVFTVSGNLSPEQLRKVTESIQP